MTWDPGFFPFFFLQVIGECSVIGVSKHICSVGSKKIHHIEGFSCCCILCLGKEGNAYIRTCNITQL